MVKDITIGTFTKRGDDLLSLSLVVVGTEPTSQWLESRLTVTFLQSKSLLDVCREECDPLGCVVKGGQSSSLSFGVIDTELTFHEASKARQRKKRGVRERKGRRSWRKIGRS